MVGRMDGWETVSYYACNLATTTHTLQQQQQHQQQQQQQQHIEG